MNDVDLQAQVAGTLFIELSKDGPVGGFGTKRPSNEDNAFRAWAMARIFVEMRGVEQHANTYNRPGFDQTALLLAKVAWR